jgi:RND family efflux transporter MFP subunit
MRNVMRPLLYFIALLAAILAGCSQSPETSAKAAAVAKAPDPIQVKVAQAESRSIERSIAVTGSLAPDDTTTVSAEVPGRVARIHADFGQAVRKGQTLAELDTQELSLQLERTRAALAQALARVGLDPRQEEATPETTPMMRQAWNQMEDARSKFENGRKLVKSGDISTERFNELEKAFKAREAAHEAARDDLRTQLAAIRSLRAEVKLAEKRLRDATVLAPFDATVSQRHVAPGQYIKDNVPILTLVKTHPLRLRADVPESAASQVRLGATLSFTTDAAPGAEFRAVVREMHPSMDARSRTLSVEARLTSADQRLRPGVFVQVKLVTSAAVQVVTVPRAALFTVAGLNKIFVVESGKAREVKLTEILGSDGWVEIPAGTIAPGSSVAVSNLPLLSNGAPVTVAGRS